MISATIISDSISSVDGKRITTFELQYPRLIHSEIMTHRMFSRNASSSRAIPVSKVIEMVRTNPAMPVRFGANQAGMQDKGVEHDHTVGVRHAWDVYPKYYPKEEAWKRAANCAADFAEGFSNAGYHKQVCNRLTEPFQWMKTIVTATEWDNFFWLRCDEDADPTIKQLADLMFEALQESTPFKLYPGEWHVPYVHATRGQEGIYYSIVNTRLFDDSCFVDVDTNIAYREITQEQALAISSSCCAQVSYRKLDDSLEKAEDIYSKLVSGRKVHASPFEHQATPMNETKETEDGWSTAINWPYFPESWECGVTHVDKTGKLWSGNFQSWVQFRQLIPNNVCKDYKEND